MIAVPVDQVIRAVLRQAGPSPGALAPPERLAPAVVEASDLMLPSNT